MSEPSADASFDAIADDLYGLRPDQFAAVRDEQVKQARAAGQAALARELGRLRRPTQSAWLINLLWRDQHEVLEQLFQLASELSEAYAEASREELQRVTAQQRQLEVALLRRARELGQQAGVAVSADTEREAQETLTAALAQPAVADEVRRGRLTRPISYAGFGAPTAAGAAALPSGAPGSGAATAATPSAGSTERGGRAPASAEAEASGAEPVPIDRHAARREAERNDAKRRAEAERQRQEAERQEAERREAERRAAERHAQLERQRQVEQRLASARSDAESAAAALAERRQAGDDAEQQRQSLRDRLAELQAEVRDVEQELSRADQAVLDTAMRRLEAEHAADLARDAVTRAEQDLAALTPAS